MPFLCFFSTYSYDLAWIFVWECWISSLVSAICIDNQCFNWLTLPLIWACFWNALKMKLHMFWKIQKDGEYLQGRTMLSALSKVNNVNKNFFCPLILYLYLIEYACAEIYKILGDQIQRELDTSAFVSTFLFFVYHLNDNIDMTRLCTITVLSLGFFFSISYKRESLEFCVREY